MRKLLTYEEASKLVEVYKDFNFSKAEFTLNGYRVVTFTYFLCEFKHFDRPLNEDPSIHGYDMRGMTFVFNKDRSLYKRFLMLSKFFNLNQVENTQYKLVKDKKIKSVSVKEDGSLVAFMNLPDGTIFAKTIGSFDNEQTAAAMKIVNADSKKEEFIRETLNKGLTPLFEYVSWDNRIVLKYGSPELRLLGFRDNNDGSFIPAHTTLASYSWNGNMAAQISPGKSLDDLIEWAETAENAEGVVIEFEDGQFIKLKSNWYFRLHGLRTTNIFREDYVIDNYLNEKLDDLLAQLDEKEDADAFKFVDRVINAVDNYLKAINIGVERLKRVYETEFNSDWTEYAKNNHAQAFFGLSVTAIQKPENYNSRKVEFIINNTKHLKKAQSFVEKWSDIKDSAISPWRK
jgi:T4 RnlA family RNA ligase